MEKNNVPYYTRLSSAWRDAWTDKLFRFKLLLVPGIFFIYSSLTQHLGNYVQARNGVRLNDALLYLFPSIDFSAPIFLLLYSSLFIILLSTIKHMSKDAMPR